MNQLMGTKLIIDYLAYVWGTWCFKSSEIFKSKLKSCSQYTTSQEIFKIEAANLYLIYKL